MGHKILADHINPFISSTMETFSTMCRIKVEPGKPYIKDKVSNPYDISGIIGLSGEAKGMVSLCFSRPVALAMMEKFVGEKYNDINEDVKDGVGELANIMSGNAKKSLTAFKIDISLPTIVMGASHNVEEAKDIVAIIVPFNSPVGSFDMMLCLKQ